MFSRFRRLQDDENGQALVVACVGLLILALGVMTTVNLGRAVNQRIGLQNTADASAYSTAALEARTFNYYAFTNRTQVVHYVSAMIFMSYLSFVTFVMAVAADVLAFLKTIDQCAPGQSPSWCVEILCQLLNALPVIGPILQAIEDVINAIEQVAENVMAVFENIFQVLDEGVAAIVEVLQGLNWAMWGSAKLVSEAVLTDLPQGYPTVVHANDDQVAMDTAVGAVLNTPSYNTAHMVEAGGNPLGQPSSLPNQSEHPGLSDSPQDPGERIAQAKRAMGEIANATRPHNFITSRTLCAFLPATMQTFCDSGIVSKMLEQVARKYGQTKLVTKAVPNNSGSTLNYIHSLGLESSVLAEGNVLGADDLYRVGVGPNKIGFGGLSVDNPLVVGEPALGPDYFGDTATWEYHSSEAPKSKLNAFVVSVWAGPGGGAHWRLLRNEDGADNLGLKSHDIPGGVFSLLGCSAKQYYADIQRDASDTLHNFEGLTPYMGFDIQKDNPTFDHQPSTMTFLSKSYAKTTRNHDGAQTVLNGNNTERSLTVATPDGNAKLETTNNVAMFAPLADHSFNVISRGMVYYHRPHNWEEPANFFNPYWRAKLDPVLQGTGEVPFLSTVMGAVPSALSGRALIH